MSSLGFVLPVLSIGLGSIIIRPTRGFYSAGDSQNPAVSLTPHVTLEEIHHDELEITEHPVDRGSKMADHAFRRPEEVVIKCAWSNSPPTLGIGGIVGPAVAMAAGNIPAVGAAVAGAQTVNAVQSLLSGNDVSQIKKVYEQLIALQRALIPFDVYTGKRAYKNMLFKALSVHTDRQTENILALTAVCREVIIVKTQTVTVPVNASAQGQPEKTTPVQDAGQKQLQPVR